MNIDLKGRPMPDTSSGRATLSGFGNGGTPVLTWSPNEVAVKRPYQIYGYPDGSVVVRRDIVSSSVVSGILTIAAKDLKAEIDVATGRGTVTVYDRSWELSSAVFEGT